MVITCMAQCVILFPHKKTYTSVNHPFVYSNWTYVVYEIRGTKQFYTVRFVFMVHRGNPQCVILQYGYLFFMLIRGAPQCVNLSK